jgi:hypothetical protein
LPISGNGILLRQEAIRVRWTEGDYQDYQRRRHGSAAASKRAPANTPPAARHLTEEEIQRAVFQHLRHRGAPGVFAFHPRNGSRDQRHLAGVNSGLGVVSGTPDVIIIKDGTVYGLELKTERGRLSPVQLKVHDEMRAAGCEVAVAYGLDQAVEWLEARGILRGSVAEGSMAPPLKGSGWFV